MRSAGIAVKNPVGGVGPGSTNRSRSLGDGAGSSDWKDDPVVPAENRDQVVFVMV
jgi:hypothetical protein